MNATTQTFSYRADRSPTGHALAVLVEQPPHKGRDRRATRYATADEAKAAARKIWRDTK